MRTAGAATAPCRPHLCALAGEGESPRPLALPLRMSPASLSPAGLRHPAFDNLHLDHHAVVRHVKAVGCKVIDQLIVGHFCIVGEMVGENRVFRRRTASSIRPLSAATFPRRRAPRLRPQSVGAVRMTTSKRNAFCASQLSSGNHAESMPYRSVLPPRSIT